MKHFRFAFCTILLVVVLSAFVSPLRAEKYFTTDTGGNNGWGVAWIDESGTSHTGVTDSTGDYYIGKNPTSSTMGLIRATTDFAGKTLYVGVNLDGTLGTLGGRYANTNSTLQVSSATVQVGDLQLGNGAISTYSGVDAGLNGAITVLSNATPVLRAYSSSVSGSTFTVGASLSGGADSTITVYTCNNPTEASPRQHKIVVTSANNTFNGTWNLTEGSFLYLGNVNDGNTNGLGKGACITMAAKSKVVLYANQELKNLTINGSGTTLTMGNGKTLRVTDTFSTDGTLIAASGVDNKLNVLAGTAGGTGSTKTLYANHIQKPSAAGQSDFYLGYGTDKYGNLYMNTLGSADTDKGMNLIQAVGKLGAYSATGNQTVTIYGNYTVSGASDVNSLNLDVAGGQKLAVTGTTTISGGLKLNATTTTALDSRKPYAVMTSTGTATGLNKITLGTNLTSYHQEVVGNTLYVGTKDSLHTYYRNVGGDITPTTSWNRFGMGTATAAGMSDTDGLYYLGYTGTTKATSTLKSAFNGKTLYLGYDVNTGNIQSSYGPDNNYGSSYVTLQLDGNYTMDLYLGKGRIFGSDGAISLQGTITVPTAADSAFTMNNSMGNQRALLINSSITGDGKITIAGRTSYKSSAATDYRKDGYLSVNHANNAFTGTWNVLNDTALLASAVGSLGNSTLLLNRGKLSDTGVEYGNSRAYLTANQTLKKVTISSADSVLSVGSEVPGNTVTLTTPTLELATDFTLSNQSFTIGGTAHTYYAGILAAQNITTTATGGVTLDLVNGTLKTELLGSATNGISLVQAGGVLEGFDLGTSTINIFGDYTQTDGTARLSLGREILNITGDLEMKSLTLFADEGFLPEEGTQYPILSWSSSSVVDLDDLVMTLETSLPEMNLRVTANGVYATVATSIPEPASWLSMLLLLLGGYWAKRKSGKEPFHV